MPSIQVRQLAAADAEDYRAIRLAALQGEPDAFGSVHAVEAPRPLADFAERLTTSMVFGACSDGRLLGVAGFKPETGPKDRHKGFVFGFYVDPEWRGRGIGSMLMEAVIACARNHVEQLTLAVVQDNDAALSLYRKFGFEAYGVEPRALKSDRGYRDEVLMALIFRPS
jgi:ribosomal protein S18 acetylase RimI-like enzyme